ncbi:MAG TPA: methyltransferase domain-containing protein [Anaerolineales bacterium]|nr:methyltransferase domain-containing protein [Anaerolineales bacterium]
MADAHPPICDYEGSKYSSEFWTGERAYEDQAEAIALLRLLPKGGNTLLELGAGTGRNTLRYAGFKQVVLLDYSISQLQQAQQNLGRNQRFLYVASDIYRLPFVEGLFDAATMIRTLHHMADPLTALKQVRNTLQPGAIFILEFANKKNIKAMLRYLVRKQSWSPYSLDSVEFETLNYDFHPQMVREWLKEAKFELLEQLAVSYFRLGVLKRRLPLNLLKRFEAWVQPTGNFCQFSPSVFTRNQAVGDSPIAQTGTFFKCPACGAYNLQPHGPRIICLECSNEYPIRDGIFDFRLQVG